MKNSEKYKVNLVISIIIVVGFITAITINYYSYSIVIKDDIKNISKLTSINIYSEINLELTKPIFVSLTMANDTFLKDWFLYEQTVQNKEEHLNVLKEYLKSIQLKYDYNSVFAISNATNKYYHYNGVNKIISKDDEHDQWYYNFINTNKDYDLDVDNDEVANNDLTVFVNCRIKDTNNELMGVVGVGVKMNYLQAKLKKFEDEYDLQAFLIDEKGLLQVSTNTQLIEKFNVYKNSDIKEFKNDIINNKDTIQMFNFKTINEEGYFITRYIKELGWYLVVKKDTSILKKSFTIQLTENIIILSIVILIIIIFSNGFIERYRFQINKMASTDQLTQLLNKRGFDQKINELLNEFKFDEIGFNVFIFDIDNFKKINDNKGHVYGDRVINLIGNYAKKIINTNGIISRWGGDEFAGIIYGTIEESENIALELIEKINSDSEFIKNNITISIGITHVEKLDIPDSILSRADKGLYIAKENGKNQLYVI